MVADGKRHPVLVFSSGYGAIPRVYSILHEEMVSHGYVVVTIAHTYWDSLTTFADGTTAGGTKGATSDQELDAELGVWIDDTKLVLDAIAGIDANDADGKLTGRLDLEKIGGYGHSFGGATSVRLAGSASCIHFRFHYCQVPFQQIAHRARPRPCGVSVGHDWLFREDLVVVAVGPYRGDKKSCPRCALDSAHFAAHASPSGARSTRLVIWKVTGSLSGSVADSFRTSRSPVSSAFTATRVSATASCDLRVGRAQGRRRSSATNSSAPASRARKRRVQSPTARTSSS
jgi:Chlorophyllase enzyme